MKNKKRTAKKGGDLFSQLFRKITKQGLTFRHGVHPEEYKSLTNHKRIERMPFVEEYVLPLSQHIGAPAKAIVQKGQSVRRGELIAEPDGYVSVGLHSPVDGTIIDIDLYDHPNGDMLPAIKIKTDPFSPQQLAQLLPEAYTQLKPEDFLTLIQRAGIVGMGGAAFPAHVKFAIPKDKRCRYLMLNGSEWRTFSYLRSPGHGGICPGVDRWDSHSEITSWAVNRSSSASK